MDISTNHPTNGWLFTSLDQKLVMACGTASGVHSHRELLPARGMAFFTGEGCEEDHSLQLFSYSIFTSPSRHCIRCHPKISQGGSRHVMLWSLYFGSYDHPSKSPPLPDGCMSFTMVTPWSHHDHQPCNSPTVEPAGARHAAILSAAMMVLNTRWNALKAVPRGAGATGEFRHSAFIFGSRKAFTIHRMK